MIRGADLFCGAGGTTTGLLNACAEAGREIELLAINHWNIAIDTHTQNHPGVRHLCDTLDKVDPRRAMPGRLDILCASPECTHHSNARGGVPCSDQSRSSAWHVVRWAEAKQPSRILIENIREFRDWGPLTRRGRPHKRFRGRTYQAFLNALESLGYRVDARILNAADYGDPTTRHRLFILARRDRLPTWPSATHRDNPRAAREIIDWDLKGQSIYGRKRPLAANTIKRIDAGLRKFGGEAFLLHLTHHTHHGPERVHAMSAPVPTITGANRGELGLIEPFLVKYYGTGGAQAVTKPLDTITARDRFGLVEPRAATLEILFRMLQPHELSRAMGFPARYVFHGNRTERIKQIGNAVPVRTATALCRELLR